MFHYPYPISRWIWKLICLSCHPIYMLVLLSQCIEFERRFHDRYRMWDRRCLFFLTCFSWVRFVFFRYFVPHLVQILSLCYWSYLFLLSIWSGWEWFNFTLHCNRTRIWFWVGVVYTPFLPSTSVSRCTSNIYLLTIRFMTLCEKIASPLVKIKPLITIWTYTKTTLNREHRINQVVHRQMTWHTPI